MPKGETVLTLFLSSPSDVVEERSAIAEEIKFLNIPFNKYLSIRLDLESWETHVSPDMGTYPQDVINKQIGDHYDIFIGIMWTRFGTETDMAGSGTEEEFNRAYARYKKNPGKIRIMFYFRDPKAAQANVDKVQLEKVKEFKKSLKEKGCLYFSYDNVRDFLIYIRLHLTSAVFDWIKTNIPDVLKELQTKIKEMSQLPEKESDRIDNGNIYKDIDKFELTYDEAVRKAMDSYKTLIQITMRIGDYFKNFSADSNSNTTELTKIRHLPKEVRLKETKKICRNQAENLNHLVNKLKSEMPLFSEKIRTGPEYFGKVVILFLGFRGNHLASLDLAHQSALKILKSIILLKTKLLELRETVNDTPKFIAVLNKAKRKTLEILNSLYQEFTNGELLTNEVEKSIGKILAITDE
ncbi:MAG: DUF4062 domain-containing protein [Candidatus Thorarchaeota archaeon]